MDYERTNGTVLSLFDDNGERKYLNEAERQQFYAALGSFECPSKRTFCKLIYFTGCRPSEALSTNFNSFNLDDGYVVIRSLKKRGKNKGKHYRIVPLPRHFIDELNEVHEIIKVQAKGSDSGMQRVWQFSRTTGWSVMSSAMQEAEIYGTRACARGLRHSFGVHAVMTKIPELRLKEWLGHAHLSTTAIYTDLAAAEDRIIAARMWREHPNIETNSYQSPSPANDDIGSVEILKLIKAYTAISSPKIRSRILAAIESHT